MENTKFTCDFCKKYFKNMSSLNHHIKTAKYCLSIQSKGTYKIIDDFICRYCNYEFKTKRNLQCHLSTCKKKLIFDIKDELKNQYNEEIKILKEKQIEEIKLLKENQLEEMNDKKKYIATLEAKIEIYEKDHDVISDIAKQTKITTNNIVNNLAIYDIDKITKQFSNKLEYITKDDIINGQKGIASILAPCLYDDNGNKMLMCTDKSRLIFTKLDENNNKIKDSELKNLATIIKPLALKKADEIVEEHNKLKEQVYIIDKLKKENEEYKKYINHFQNIIDNYKTSNTNNKLIIEYERKIQTYKEQIKTNEIIIYDSNNFKEVDELEDENEKLLDGHIEIQYLDKESSKFARQLSKMI